MISVCLLLLSLIPITCNAIQCYTCGNLDTLIPITVPLDAVTLESYTPANCKTNLITDITYTHCLAYLIIDFYQSASLGTIMYTHYTSFNYSNSVIDKTVDRVSIYLGSVLSSNTSENMYRIVYTLSCSGNGCNTFERMKLAFSSTILEFNYQLVMNRLYSSSSIPSPLSCLDYSNYPPLTPPGCSNRPCGKSSSFSSCIQCTTATCQHYSCGSCSKYEGGVNSDDTLASLMVWQTCLGNNNTSALKSSEFTCNTPNCNSIENQAEIQKLYTLDFRCGILDVVTIPSSTKDRPSNRTVPSNTNEPSNETATPLPTTSTSVSWYSKMKLFGILLVMLLTKYS